MPGKALEVVRDFGEFLVPDTSAGSPDAENSDTADHNTETQRRTRRGLRAANANVIGGGNTDNEGVSGAATEYTDFSHKGLYESVYEEPDDLKTPTRPKALRTGRAITAPPQLTLRTSPPTNEQTKTLALPERKRESPTLSSSEGSFDSFHSPISPLMSSPPFPTSPGEDYAGIVIHPIRNYKPDASEITVTAPSHELWDMSDAKSADGIAYHSPPDLTGTPPLISDAASQDDDHSSEPTTPSPHTKLRRHGIRRRRRNQSPLPPPSNLYSPYSPRSHISGHHMTTAILQKTWSLLLGPPIQLVALMMRIAAKIAQGASRGTSFGFGHGGQKIPCSWDFSDASDGADDIWEEDDYGFSLRKSLPSKDAHAGESSGSVSNFLIRNVSHSCLHLSRNTHCRLCRLPQPSSDSISRLEQEITDWRFCSGRSTDTRHSYCMPIVGYVVRRDLQNNWVMTLRRGSGEDLLGFMNCIERTPLLRRTPGIWPFMHIRLYACTTT